MKKTLAIILVLAGLYSCKQHNKFHISGKIADAKGEMLYFEHSGLMKTTVIDSTKLGTNGEFSFKSTRPAYPDFYRLRLSNDKIITFAVDSCEDISIEAKSARFATDYKLTGSETSLQIQKLRQSVMDIQEKANLLATISPEKQNAEIEKIEQQIEAHKKIAEALILKNPRSLAAYFALYQKVNNSFLFSPYIKSDKAYYAAVATSFNSFMPDYDRSKNIYSLVLDAIKTERTQRGKEAWKEVLAKHSTGYIDIALPDKNNVVRKLSQLEGKVILIDFSTHEVAESVDYTFALRELYNKYHNRGFEIYQISLDQNKSLWKQSVANIPWVCVRDEDGPNTRVISSYNVSIVPTTFLMNRKGIIIGRDFSLEDLKSEIEKSL